MKKGILIISGVILLIIAIIFDNEIASSVINYRTPFLTALMFTFSFLGSALMVFILITLMFLFEKKKRQYIPLLWLNLLAALLIGYIIKFLVARPRPTIMPLEIKNSYSFPSLHAVMSFAPLLLIDKEFPKLKWLWFCIAVLVLVSRLYLGVHYLSDVIAGALIGYITGLLVLTLTRNI